MTTGTLTWKQAIIQVLQRAGMPLHCRDVCTQISEQGLREVTGKTPEATVNTQLIYLQREGIVEKVGPGVFVLRNTISPPENGDTKRVVEPVVASGNGLTWSEAVLHVLKAAGKELHYKEVTRRILNEGLKETSGKTPQDTVYVTLSGLADRQRVLKVRPGEFVLVGNEGDDSSSTGLGAETLAVAACGLHWRRDVVDWRRSNTSGELLGRRERDRLLVDFADQDGIYLLHDAKKDIVYVGQTYTPNVEGGLYARLQEHANNRSKNSRWDYFSWFGFRPVDESTRTLGTGPNAAKLPNIINVLETILILGLDPRLNAVGGRGSAQLEANRFSQVVLTVHN